MLVNRVAQLDVSPCLGGVEDRHPELADPDAAHALSTDEIQVEPREARREVQAARSKQPSPLADAAPKGPAPATATPPAGERESPGMFSAVRNMFSTSNKTDPNAAARSEPSPG